MASKKRKIASLCEMIVSNPEGSLKRPAEDATKTQLAPMMELLALCSSEEKVTRKYAMASLAAVYADVLPSYRLRELTRAEKDQKLSKEVFTLRRNEEALLTSYGAYIKLLTQHPKDVVMARCVGELWVARPFFNFRDDVVALVAEAADAEDQDVRTDAVQALKEGFQRDKTREGDATFAAVKAIHKVIQRKGVSKVKSDIVAALETLDIQPREPERNIEKMAYQALKDAEVKQKKASQKKKRRRVSQADVKAAEASLREGSAEVDQVLYEKFQRDIIHEVALVYARILKGGQRRTDDLFGAATRGFARIAPAVNADIVTEVLDLLKGTANAKMPPVVRLQAATAALAIADASPAYREALGQDLIDDAALVDALYDALLSARSTTALRVAVETTTRCFLGLSTRGARRHKADRRSDIRAAAFARRALHLALAHTDDDDDDENTIPKLLVTLATALFQAYPALNTIVDDLEPPPPGVTGLGARYDAAASHVDAVNPLAIPAWELLVLARHFNPDLRRRATLLLQPPNSRSIPHADADPRTLLANIRPSP